MFNRNRGIIIGGLASVALSGCATPPHTNLLIFGTNAVVGLKVGADATQTPAIQVGYARQELVLMPLLANTGGTGDKLTPCPYVAGTPAVLPLNCKYIGAASGDQDAYSVMASFGAKFDASKGTTPQAGGAIAQYFATGLAARELATHGASLVAASPAAAAEAISGSPATRALITAKLGPAVAEHVKITDARTQVASMYLAAGDNGQARLQKFDAAISAAGASRANFTNACQNRAKNDCAAILLNGDSLDDLSLDDWTKVAQAGG